MAFLRPPVPGEDLEEDTEDDDLEEETDEEDELELELDDTTVITGLSLPLLPSALMMLNRFSRGDILVDVSVRTDGVTISTTSTLS